MSRIANASTITLVPKCNNPSAMNHFRPISCCNSIYKCVSKMLANRMKLVLPSLISFSQSAFIKDRTIGDNIFLVQALCRNYNADRGPPRCAIKLELHKAFDSVNWSFIIKTLMKMCFPSQFIRWIEGCISSAWFSVKVKGVLEGFFHGKSDLRQGDPISPYLFGIKMEVLSALIERNTLSDQFSFH